MTARPGTTTRPELWGSRGAASSTHWLASAAGASMYDHGGTAFDAAVATGLVLQVVEPHLNGLGGDVSIVFHDGASGATKAICGQGPMPVTASIDAFHKLGLETIPGSGLLAATVPGAFGAWMRLLAEHGTLPLRTVLEPAIHYAETGVPLLPKAAEMIAAVQPVFAEHWPESGRVFLANGQAPRAGQRWRNPYLAGTYRRLLAEGEAKGQTREGVIQAASDAFYQGFVAEIIDDYVTDNAVLDATGDAHAGLLTGNDLATWTAEEEATLSLTYGDRVVHKAGPWTQGPVFLQQLALLRDIGGTEFLSADYVHRMTEVTKLAFADREAWYGDPRFTDDLTPWLLDPDYNRARAALISDKASLELRPGTVAGRQPRLPDLPLGELEPTDPPWLVQLREGIPVTVPVALLATQTSGDTCCATASDDKGNLVAATPSGGWLKSSPVLPGLGFPLGTRGQMAWLDAGHPNALVGGKRPRTTLSPTIVERGGRGELAFGTPGGDQQDQWTLQAFLAHTTFGLGLQEAVEAAAFHSDHVPTSFAPRRVAPGVVTVESGIGRDVISALETRGHTVKVVPDQTLGKVCFAAVGADESCRAAASPNGGQAYAIVR
ncbi:gamma-glutamyltransferase family protein [Actinokineospora globicatena]|uniref:gamma-glutamyltransferase family protein n=1 Tax=Actinokineospora globicatena TaxID=103729 RepID=UPI0020A41D6F|nr:gamma-glutamyltransferase [Actinokineospora globicatena]MCP2303965.1 gamma-glutamyltranspeptidase / glutathione hydrolase [Actinokineospora globicatena]GLW78873.1 gamma-glutamyltranspeptidase [Actinokineospora globicatena]